MRNRLRSHTVAIAIILAASVALSACGRKGPPEAPVAAAPVSEAGAESP